jgi:hypothetical protein
MTTNYITLGYHCNISFLTEAIHMKNETGLFEWLESGRLSYITDVINVIKNDINTNIIQGINYNIYILHKYLYTYHYNLEEYKSIFLRRATRFLDVINKSSELICIRINPYGVESTSIEEINNFVQSLRSINPNINIKFLLINTINIDDKNELDKTMLVSNVYLLQKYFYHEDTKDDAYLKNNEKINKLFYNYMKEIGYNIQECMKNFTDKS